MRRVVAAAWPWGVVLAVVGGCGPSADKPREMPIPKVSVIEVAEYATSDHDEYVGRLAAPEIVDVRSRVHGFIKTVEFQDGDMVELGQTLYTIEPDEYNSIHQQSLSRIAVWESKHQLAKSKLARTEKLLKTGAATPEEHEEAIAAEREAVASIAAAKADAERSALDLKYTVIQAPISGRIGRTALTPGNLVSGGLGSGTSLTQIVKIDPIYVNIDVDEQALLRYQSLKKEAEASTSLREKEIPCLIQLADEKNFPRAGTLDFVENQLNAGTGTIRVRGVVANPDRKLVPGMFVRVRIPVSDDYQAVMIPDAAVSSDLNIKYAYVVGSDGAVTRRNLQLGDLRGSLRIVRDGLEPSDRVIVKGQQRVRPGEVVEVLVEKMEPPAGESAASNGPPSA